MLRDSEAFGVFVVSATAMETCRDPWGQLYLEAPACVPTCLAAGFGSMLNQLLLGAGRKADSDFTDLVLPGFTHSLSPSLCFAALPCRAVRLL